MVGCDDAPDVANLIEEVADHGQPFSSRHRIVDTRGRVHPVPVVGDLLTDAEGTCTPRWPISPRTGPSSSRPRAS
jgi:hypothetical protein